MNNEEQIMWVTEIRDQEIVYKEILSIDYKEKNCADEMDKSDKALVASA